MKKLADNFQRIGLHVNVDKTLGAQTVRKAAAIIRRAGRKAVADAATAEMAKWKGETVETDSVWRGNPARSLATKRSDATEQ